MILTEYEKENTSRDTPIQEGTSEGSATLRKRKEIVKEHGKPGAFWKEPVNVVNVLGLG